MLYAVRDYWAEVRAAEGTLPEYCFIISLEDKLLARAGGVITEVGRAVAARSIVSKTHRLATPAEVETHRAAEQQCAAAVAEARKKAGRGVYVLPPLDTLAAKEKEKGR